MEILFPTLCQLDFYVVLEGDWGLVIVFVFNEMVEINEVRLMSAEEIFAWKAVLNLFQDLS